MSNQPVSKTLLKAAIQYLATSGVLIGTSSWKYVGWLNLFYTPERYFKNGRFCQRKFEEECLQEYSEIFPTVGVDFTYYQSVSSEQIKKLCSQVPDNFKFVCKAPSAVTIKKYPHLEKFKSKAGTFNLNYLNPQVFVDRFILPWRDFQDKLGLTIFEFSKFSPSEYNSVTQFVEDLDRFLDKIPHDGWRYGIEIRNHEFLTKPYFDVLHRYNVTHVYNSWTDMPPIIEQLAIGSFINRSHLRVVRLLLKPGRKYEEAVKMFYPYNELKDDYPAGRQGAIQLIHHTLRSNGKIKSFIYVNNRFEGNAIHSIWLILKESLGLELINELTTKLNGCKSYCQQQLPLLQYGYRYS